MGHNPSYYWRSVWSSQSILKEGFRWRVGEGSRINIWRQPWLRDDIKMLQSTPIAGSEMLTVKDLRSADLQGWNMDLLNAISTEEDVQRVIQVPLISCDQEDKLIWSCTNNGLYSVKSGYRLLCEKIAPRTHLCVDGDWSAIWTLKVAPRVKSCLWRACRNVLPTRTCLQQRGVHCPVTCVHCPNEMENCFHLFFTCRIAEECWRHANLWSIIEPLLSQVESLKELCLKLLVMCGAEQLANDLCNNYLEHLEVQE